MKKGFTLIELLGVIVVLGVIGAIVTPVIQNSLRESAIESCNIQVESFEKAARNYVNQNPFGRGSQKCVSLLELQDLGFLKDGALKNPVDENNFTSSWKVSLIGDNNNAEFKFNYDCSTKVYIDPSC